MSFFTDIFPVANEARPAATPSRAGGIRSATGLSRAALAALFRDNGLFGAESDLAPVEQAVVQSRLGRIPGLRPRPVTAPTDARLLALVVFTDAVVRGDGSASDCDAAQLRAAGYSEPQLREVVGVVRNVREVFGLPIATVRVDAASITTRPTLARAA